MNYYEILEVSPKASSLVIRAAYKSLMQRYHPDKDSGDAERAALVVQAYDVLSDEARRSSYDLALKEVLKRGRSNEARRAQRVPREALVVKKGRWSLALLCLMLALVFLGWMKVFPFKSKALPPGTPQQSAQPAEHALSTVPVAPVAPVLARRPQVSRELVIARQFETELKSGKWPVDTTKRTLLIPELAVRVGERDPESAIKHLENTVDSISEKLKVELAKVNFEELDNADGERYLIDRILSIMTEQSVTAKTEPAVATTVSAERYGVIEIILPRYYSLR